nr:MULTISPECIES: M20/M25/M40 family metallo-hydrolase [unclassified Brevibacterium]
MLGDIERLITIETPSEDKEAVAAGARVTADIVQQRLGARPAEVIVEGTPHLVLRFGAESAGERPADYQPRVVLVDHQDTVWPHGTLERKPFQVADGVLTGPGSFDMLTGDVMAFTAVQLLQEAVAAAGGDPQAALAGLTVLVTGDEEIGSPTSAGLIQDEARGARAAYVMEASGTGSTGPGALKVERKGTSMYVVEVHGRASHAGLEPEKGINAGLELASLLQQVATFGDAGLGTSVTPTRLSGGTTTNTVPAYAQFDVDVRAKTVAEQERVDAAIRALTPQHAEAKIVIRGGINRPPLERAMAQGLFDRALALSESLGIEAPEGIEVGGASDGNFTAGIGVPTLDGLGAVGDGAHAEHEHALVDYIAPRTALLAALIADQLWAD